MNNNVPMLDLRAEYADLKADIDAAIQRVIESVRFVLGEEVAAFEDEFARYTGAPYAVGVGSGTAALCLGLLASGVGPGDQVITVPNTDVPTTMAITSCGADIVWVDVEPDSFTIDPEKIEGKVTPATRAILPVHLFGHPAEMDPIMEIAQRHDLLVIEDAALAVGAEYRGRKVGTIGDIGCFSLAPGKILGAYGDAGIVVTGSAQIADRLRVLRNYGHDLSMVHRQPQAVWKVATEGFNERPDTLQAAILRAKLSTLEQRIAARRAAAARYDALLAGLHLVTPSPPQNVRHVYRAYTILVAHRDRVRDQLTAKGIETQVYYAPPLHLQPAYQRFEFHRGSFPTSEAIAEQMLSLPLFPEMREDQTAAVVTALEASVSPRAS